MTENKSLADQAVEALAMVKAMDEGKMTLDNPERHTVRNLKRSAEALLAEAFRQAQTLAYIAGDISGLVAEVKLEEAKRALENL
jgi:hypothetical protein